MVRIREYYQEENTPTAQDVVAAAFAAVRNSAGQLLLVRRIDDGNWELPGGRIEVGESVVQALVREVAEESGIVLEVTGIAGVYSDPSHVLEDPGGIVHQQLAICFHAEPARSVDGQRPRSDGIETDAAGWFDVGEIADLKTHPAMRLRIDNALRAPGRAFLDDASPDSDRSPTTETVRSVGVPEQRQPASY